ncbi:MAG: OmpH family outer membrane protein [Bacteroidota bacterium]
MKNLSLIINVVLLVAVGFLYVKQFSGPGSPESQDGEEITASDSLKTIDYDLAYINSDSLVKNYQYFADKQKELQGKQTKLESEYINRAEGLQSQISDFQQTAGTMTINQARAIEEDLVKKQQNLLKYQDNIRAQLIQEENKINQEIYGEIDEFLKVYGKENDLKMVMTYVYGGTILYADGALDVTQDVISKLNERYASGTSDSSEAEGPN